MADVSDLSLTADQLSRAMAALRDAWRRRHPGILDDQLPEALRMTEPTPQPAELQLYEDYYLDAPGPKMPKGDARVSYRAAGEGAEATCYGCRFYGWSTCQLVEGTIEASDVCDLHLPAPKVAPDMAFAEPTDHQAASGTGTGAHIFRNFRRPLTFSGASEWVQFLPPPGTYHHLLYGELELSAERYAHIVQNFTNQTYAQTLPINAEHDSAASGAVGYITDMRIADDGSVEVKPEWNDRGTALIEGDRFRYVSAEFFDRWQDPVSGEWHDDVAFGMAICTNPHFKETVLRPLAATEQRPAVRSTPAIRRRGVAGMPSPEKPENRTVTLTEEEVTRLREADSRLTAAEAQNTTLAEQNTQLAERVAAMETDARRRRFTDLVAGRGKDGLPWFGDADKHVGLLETLAAQFGEESDQVKAYTEQQQGIAAQLKSSQFFTEIGSSRGDGDDTESKVATLAGELRKANPKLTPEQAEAQVYSEHPDLYEAAMRGDR